MIVLLTYGTLFLYDVARARIINHSSARYAAFAMAHTAMHDYGDDSPVDIPANIPIVGGMFGQLGRASAAVQAQSTLFEQQRRTEEPPAVLTIRKDPVTLAYDHVKHFPGRTVTDISDALGGSADASLVMGIASSIINYILQGLVWQMGYNSAPMVRATSSTHVGTARFPWTAVGYTSRQATTLRLGFDITDEVALIADPWALDDGSDVRPGGYKGHENISNSGQPVARMQKQVARLFIGQGVIFKLLLKDTKGDMQSALDSFNGLLGNLLGTDPLGGPFSARVAMYNYRKDLDGRQSPNANMWGRTSTEINLGAERMGQEEIFFFDTTQMAEDPQAPGTSPMLEAYRLRGKWFMGCPNAERVNCDYQP